MLRKKKVLRMIKETFISVGEYSLFMRQAGQGKPIVILEAGAAEDSTTWENILPLVAQFSQVMTYDRAGLEHSTGPSSSRTA
jgi:hypothetical protein